MDNFSKMKKATIMSILFCLPVFAIAQTGKSQSKIEAAKIGLISERLGLSPKQAQDFWPLYNEYTKQRKQNQKIFRDARHDFDPNTATEEESKKMLKLGRNVKENQLKLDREYSDRLLTVINSKQLMSLHKAEQDFRQMILRKLEQRRNQQQNRDRNRTQNNERMRNKRNN